MKWLTHYDQYCDEFIEFADNIIEQSEVQHILESICEFGNGKDVIVTDRCSLDREGGNHEIVGYIIHGDREFAFKVVSGNWNGTEVLNWEENSSFRLTDRSEWYN